MLQYDDNLNGVITLRSFIAYLCITLLPRVRNLPFYVIEHFRKLRYFPLAKCELILLYTNFIYTK